MCKLSLRPCIFVGAGVLAVALTLYCAVGFSRSAQQALPLPAAPLEDPNWKTKGYKYTGADGCTPCHVTPQFGYETDFVKLTEYATWKTLDKHSLAAAALRGKRGKEMSMRLAKNETFVLKPEGGCLGCHSSYFPNQSNAPEKLTEGVSCDACHGPASNWRLIHDGKEANPPWRTKTVKEKHDLGMRNLRDPVERAQLCNSCHIGSAEEGRVVTHAMYAAGHPPLPSFEVASFSRALPPHWDEKKDVKLFTAKYDDFKTLYNLDEKLPNTRLVLTGGAASLRQQLALVAGRATLSESWPELNLPQLAEEQDPKSLWDLAAMAHSDCAACHHDLRVPSWRAERGYGLSLLDGTFLRSKPGRLQPSLWSLPLLGALEVQPNEVKALNDALTKLHTACDARPFGNIVAVGKAAAAARDAVNLQHKPDEAAAKKLLKRLTEMAAKRTLDFDTARQFVAAFSVIYTELKPDHANDARIRKIIAEMGSKLNLFAPANLAPRFKNVAECMEEVLGKKIPLEESPEQMQMALQSAYVEMKPQQQANLFKVLLDPKHVDAMQELRDRELAAITRGMGEYDPASFKKQMAELHKLVSEMTPK